MSAEILTAIPSAVVAAVESGTRLDPDAVCLLARLTDILALGALADDACQRRHGRVVTFVRVHALDVSAPGQWSAMPPAAQEVRLVGTATTAAGALDAVGRARTLAGGRVVRGFDLADLLALGDSALLAELASAGLHEVATVDAGPDAVAAVRTAREAGLGVRVIGLAAPVADRAHWILEVRALADAVGGIEAVSPLPRTADPTTPTTGFDDVRSVALTRLALDLVPHVQVDWQRHGPKLAQVALTVGADDLDAVSADDDTSRGTRRAPLEEVRRNITAAARSPLERDGRFGRLDTVSGRSGVE